MCSVHQNDHIEEAKSEDQAKIKPPNDTLLLLYSESVNTLITGKCKHCIFDLMAILETYFLHVRGSFGHGCWLAGYGLTMTKMEGNDTGEQRSSVSEREKGNIEIRNLSSVLARHGRPYIELTSD